MILHCNSSLPRSGSELLQALLAQHPDVYASATSPVLEYWYGAMSNITLPEVRSQDSEGMAQAFKGFCRLGTQGYYGALTSKPVVVDKSRGWLEYAELLWDVYPQAKIVCMVRDIGDILASLEKIYQANPMHPETRSLPRAKDARYDAWMHPDSTPLGLALTRLNARKSKGHDSRIKYVQYEDLVASPVDIMQAVFSHLEVPPYAVDPMNVVKSVPEIAGAYGIFGDHTLRPVVSKS